MNEIITQFKDDFLTIEIPYSSIYEDKIVKDFLSYIKIKNITSKSKAKDEDIEKLSVEIKQKMWKENKDLLLGE